jgi:hypothetical protein
MGHTQLKNCVQGGHVEHKGGSDRSEGRATKKAGGKREKKRFLIPRPLTKIDRPA